MLRWAMELRNRDAIICGESSIDGGSGRCQSVLSQLHRTHPVRICGLGHWWRGSPLLRQLVGSCLRNSLWTHRESEPSSIREQFGVAAEGKLRWQLAVQEESVGMSPVRGRDGKPILRVTRFIRHEEEQDSRFGRSFRH